MATATYNATPPSLSSCNNNYRAWKKLIKHWQNLCSLSKPNRASAILLTLSGKALNAALQIPEEDLAKDDGVETLLKQLDTLYIKDELSEKFKALETFETYRRPSSSSIRDFLIEFENKHFKIKEFKVTTDDLLGFRLIKAANLSPDKEELIKATVTELTYNEVKTKMSKIFSDESQIPAPSSSMSTSQQQETFATSSEYVQDDDEPLSNSDEEEAYYANYRHDQRQPRRQVSFNPRRNTRSSNDRPSILKNWRSPERNNDKKFIQKPARNSVDKYGNQTRCSVCESINHWANNCPDRRDKDTYLVYEIILHANRHSPEHMQTLVGETWNSGLLDCGATRTVCGSKWLEEYILSLSDEDKESVSYSPSNSVFRFGDGIRVQAKQSAKIPAYVGDTKLSFTTDIIDNDLPLLLSKPFMKRNKMKLDFDKDIAIFHGQTLPLRTTGTGHYALPLTKATQFINFVNTLPHDDPNPPQINLILRKELTTNEIAIKLHRQFAHPPKERLQQLLRMSGPPWCHDQNLYKAISTISDECESCQKYGKAPARPIVGLPMATQFLETVAMDIKFYKGKPILHLIDLCTKLSAAYIMSNKQPETVLKTILQIWISVYGATDKFLVDNGGEFANDDFINLAEKFGIVVKTTAGYSPWSNGTVERHNQTLSQMMDKVLDDTSCDLPTAVAWCVNAKNSLANMSGFSPYQLSIGTNPKLPSTLTDTLPSLTAPVTSKVLSDHLQAIHKAREAFIACENSDKIRRALTHNVRSSGDVKYVTGDSVYFKRDDTSAWHGPGKVLGQDGQQVLIKQGSYYVRVHPCRVRFVKEPISSTTNNHQNTTESQSSDQNSIEIESQPSKHSSTISMNQLQELDVANLPQVNRDIENTVASAPSVSSNLSNVPVEPSINDTVSTQSLQSTEGRAIPNVPLKDLKIQPGQNVTYENEKGTVISATINSRAGKAKGLYPHWWNITHNDGTKVAIDFAKVKVLDSSVHPNKPSEDIFLLDTKEQISTAKQNELNEWKHQNVYTEIDYDNQDTIALRWVCTPKMIDGIPSIKARLVAKGFQEQQLVRGDSPTCSREGVRISLAIISSNNWILNSLDIKTAFLQGGPIDREVFVIPPKEAMTNKIWKLNKAIYGLNDASRNWYLKLRKVLVSLGGTPMKLDAGIFCWYQNSTLIGLMSCFVDDILWGGNNSFNAIILQLKDHFKVGSENDTVLDYIGTHIKQNPDRSMILCQNSYVEDLQPIPLNNINTTDKSRLLADVEKSILRGALGQLNWLAGITRPEVSFSVSEISSRIGSATVADIFAVNRTIKFVKNTTGYIKIPNLDLKTLKIIAFSDSSFNNLNNGNSQGAYIVFMSDINNSCCPISWSSNKVKRVVRSTLAAETLAFTEAADSAYFIRELLQEVLCVPSSPNIPISSVTDSQSLFETLGTSNQISDRRLRVEVSALREMIENDEICAQWVKKEDQLSDVLTKKGASPVSLMRTLQRGSFCKQL